MLLRWDELNITAKPVPSQTPAFLSMRVRAVDGPANRPWSRLKRIIYAARRKQRDANGRTNHRGRGTDRTIRLHAASSRGKRVVGVGCARAGRACASTARAAFSAWRQCATGRERAASRVARDAGPNDTARSIGGVSPIECIGSKRGISRTRSIGSKLGIVSKQGINGTQSIG
ncbi:hypothetical protein [Caballeronia sp. M1242]|uniref:hypothetical protein n=1 Tax=Caballeronia sp. M1242 TaxID=2814653 RepID=UPI0019CF6B6E|nr:hypothetical protein JYK05_15315 [Caballeronia sp. M1242]